MKVASKCFLLWSTTIKKFLKKSFVVLFIFTQCENELMFFCCSSNSTVNEFSFSRKFFITVLQKISDVPANHREIGTSILDK